jgi:hypothetical protein
MLRQDLDAARSKWLAEVEDDPSVHSERQSSDFLLVTNHDGEILDFHSLRHTCGARLASTGEAAKTIRAVMRHSSITLTMDRYGHLLPGTESRAADKLGAMVGRCVEPELGRADEPPVVPAGAQPLAQRADCENSLFPAVTYEAVREGQVPCTEEKPLADKDLCDVLQSSATECESAPSWTRTMNLLI